MFCKTGVLRNFTKFTGRHLCQGLFFNKVEGPRHFLQTTFFPEHLWAAASEKKKNSAICAKWFIKHKEKHLSVIVRHIYLKATLFWIWIGLMLAVVSRFFFYKNIARHLSRKFADNRHKYKASFLWWVPTNLRVFIVCEANFSNLFCYLIKKCKDDILSEERADRKKTHKDRTDNLCQIGL